MAYSERTTMIANPARGRRKMKRRNPRRKLTAKQTKFFGTKRQRAALKRHRTRTVAKPRSNPPKRRSIPTSSRRRHAARKRTNPAEVISLMLGNPAKRRNMAQRKHTRARKQNAGRARRTNSARRPCRNPAVMHRRRRANPGRMGDIFTMALGVAAGAVGSKIGAQTVLGTSNTGVMGYAGNAAAGGALAWAAHEFLKKPIVTQSVLVGTAVQILLRVISDYSLLGSYSAQLGVGDYMVANWVSPQRLPDAFHSANVEIPKGWAPSTVVASSGASAANLGLEPSRG